MLRSSTSKQEVVHLVLALLTTHLEVDQVDLTLAEGREQRVRDVHREVGADGLLGLSSQGEGHGQGQGQG